MAKQLSYAEILLDLVQHGPQTQAGLEMARACTVRARVERILAASTAPAKAGWRRRIWTAAVIAPVVVASAGSIAYRAPVTTLAIDGAGDATTAMRRPQQVDFFSLGPASIFAVSREGDELFGQLTWQRKLRLAKALDGTYSYPGAPGQITLSVSDERQPPEVTLSQNGHDRRAVRLAEIAWQGSEADAGPLESYVGWYELSQSRVLTVTRDGNRLYAQETGRPKFEVAARSADAFAGDNGDLAIFLRDGEARVTKVLLHEPMSGARLAPRVDAARAGMIEQEFARRIAEVPDPFKEQVPLAGSREAILRGIGDLQRGAPNYDRMSASLAGRIHEHVSELHAMLKAFGAVESDLLSRRRSRRLRHLWREVRQWFGGVSNSVAADGKADDVLFRPDGNDALGGVAACSDEQAFEVPGDTAPIKLTIYNGSGSDIRLYSLDSEGKRSAHGSIGDDMSSSIVTEVENPMGHRRCFREMSGDRVAGTTHALSCCRAIPGRWSARACGAATHRAAGRQRTDAAPIHRGAGPGRAELRSHDPRSGGLDAPAACFELGDSEPAWRAASGNVSRSDFARQRHLRHPFRQWFGGMAHRPGQGRHDREACAGSAVEDLRRGPWPASSADRPGDREMCAAPARVISGLPRNGHTATVRSVTLGSFASQSWARQTVSPPRGSFGSFGAFAMSSYAKAEALLALHRFGLGPRPGSIAAIETDPRGALIAELERPPASLAAASALPSSASAYRTVNEANAKRQARAIVAKREQEATRQRMAETPMMAEGVGQGDTEMAAKIAADAVPDPGRGIYLEEAKICTEAALTAEIGFTERLVWFWSNHFCISADKI